MRSIRITGVVNSSPFSLAKKYGYEIREKGEVIKTGSGGGPDGAYAAATKALARMADKEGSA